MKQLIKRLYELRQDRVFTWSWRITLFIFVIFLLLLVFYWNRLPQTLPFFYSLPWGEEQLTTPFVFIVALIGAALMYVLDVIFASFIYPKYRVFTHILVIGATSVVILMIFSLTKIVFLIT